MELLLALIIALLKLPGQLLGAASQPSGDGNLRPGPQRQDLVAVKHQRARPEDHRKGSAKVFVFLWPNFKVLQNWFEIWRLRQMTKASKKANL